MDKRKAFIRATSGMQEDSAAQDRQFVAEMRKAQEAVLAEGWTENVEGEASVADVLRLCALAEKGLLARKSRPNPMVERDRVAHRAWDDE